MANIIEMDRELRALREEFDLLRRDITPKPVRHPVPAAATAPFKLGVVRDIGTGNDDFILVQRVMQIGDEPGWKFSSVAAESVACWPDVVSGEYEPFLSTWDDPWARNVGIVHIPLIRAELSWIALPMTAMEMVEISKLIALMRTDGFIPQA